MLQCLCKFSKEFLCLYSAMIWIFALQGSRKSLFPVCTYFLPENTTLIQGNWCRVTQHQSMDPWLLSVLGHQSYKSLIFDKKNQNTMQLYHGQMTLLFMLEARTPLGFFSPLGEGLCCFLAPLDHLIFVVVLQDFHHK